MHETLISKIRDKRYLNCTYFYVLALKATSTNFLNRSGKVRRHSKGVIYSNVELNIYF